MEITGTVRQILAAKGGSVLSIHPQATVFDALTVMGGHNIGALVVIDENDRVIGVVSERDYSRKVVLQNRTSRGTLVAEILSQPAITVTPDSTIDECMQHMTARRIRHLPVLDGENLVGVVSIGDVVNWIMREQHHAIRQLTGYIRGGGYPG